MKNKTRIKEYFKNIFKTQKELSYEEQVAPILSYVEELKKNIKNDKTINIEPFKITHNFFYYLIDDIIYTNDDDLLKKFFNDFFIQTNIFSKLPPVYLKTIIKKIIYYNNK